MSKVQNIRRSVFLTSFLPMAILLSSCGGGSENPASVDEAPPVAQPPMAPTPAPPEPGNPDPNNSAPVISLNGNRLIRLSINEDYVEEGATATDEEDGDVSSNITAVGAVNTGVIGDYFLRYEITDSGGSSKSVSRIVRVYETAPTRLSRRQITTTGANLAYLEHLPVSYGESENVKSPLIIFNHGSGATGTRNLADVECCGLPLVLRQSGWDSSRPFVILSPHRISGIEPAPLDTFIEYALANYDIDPKRIYMAGWSQGAFVSLRYAINYPTKLSAIGAMAGGFFQGVPNNVCIAANKVPLWTFLGARDAQGINNVGIAATTAFNNCAPTERAKLTTHTTADHFATSNWPFQPEINQTITVSSDPLDQSIYDWFLSHSLP